MKSALDWAPFLISHSAHNSISSLRFSFQIDQSELADMLGNSAWQYDRQNLRLLTVLGEGNFGKVIWISIEGGVPVVVDR